MNAVAARASRQGMQIEAGHEKLIDSLGRIQCVQPTQAASLQILADPCRLTPLEKLGKSLVPEALDHRSKLVAGPLYVKRWFT